MQHIFSETITSFAFLDHDSLLVSGFASFQPELRVVAIDDSLTSTTLILPELVLGPPDTRLQIATAPPPSWAATTPHTEQLLIISFQNSDSDRGIEPAYLLCIPLTAITKIRAKTIGGHRTFFWDRWGPHNTRMFSGFLSEDPWDRYVYGQRCIVQTTKMQWTIVDFNRFSVGPGIRMSEETTVDGSQKKFRRMFASPVTTWAPFTHYSVSTPDNTKAVLLAEDALVAVSVRCSSLASFSALTRCVYIGGSS